MSESDDEGDDEPETDGREFAAVYAEIANELHAFAAALLHGAELTSQTQDVVQEAVSGLWRRYKQTGEVPDNWAAVMMAEVRYRALDFMKRADVKHAGFSLDDPANPFEPVALGDFAYDHAASAEVRGALQSLDPREREVLYRLFYEDQTQANIADELDLSLGRITQIKHAALEKIADTIYPEGGEPK